MKAVPKQVGHKAREMTQTGEAINNETPENTSSFRGSADVFATLQPELITRPGLEPLPPNTGETAHCESGGQPSSPFVSDCELRAVVDAWGRRSVPARRKILGALQEDVTSIYPSDCDSAG